MKKTILLLSLVGSFIWGSVITAPRKDPLLRIDYLIMERIAFYDCDKNSLKSESAIEDFIDNINEVIVPEKSNLKSIFKVKDKDKSVLTIVYFQTMDIHIALNYEKSAIFMKIFSNQVVNNEMISCVAALMFGAKKIRMVIDYKI